jgi:hypothetical protein
MPATVITILLWDIEDDEPVTVSGVVETAELVVESPHVLYNSMMRNLSVDFNPTPTRLMAAVALV